MKKVEHQKLATWLTILVVVISVCHIADAQSSGNFLWKSRTISDFLISDSKYVYKISTGEIQLVLGYGYSGKKGTCRDNPSCTAEKNVGPIPVGLYSIGRSYNSMKVGPLALPLTPIGGQDMFNRSAFLIHGDNTAGDASEGCIVLARNLRQKISTDKIRKLEVIPWSFNEDEVILFFK